MPSQRDSLRCVSIVPVLWCANLRPRTARHSHAHTHTSPHIHIHTHRQTDTLLVPMVITHSCLLEPKRERSQANKGPIHENRMLEGALREEKKWQSRGHHLPVRIQPHIFSYLLIDSLPEDWRTPKPKVLPRLFAQSFKTGDRINLITVKRKITTYSDGSLSVIANMPEISLEFRRLILTESKLPMA